MLTKQQKLSLAYLHQIIDYDPFTGILRWKIKRNSFRGHVRPGAIVGTIDRNGHRYTTIDGMRFMVHRLAWFHYYGFWPIGEIDHKNMTEDDNRIENLRDIGHNRSLQRANQRVRRDNKLGVKGVSKQGGRYRARLKGRELGYYKTPEEAHAAYVSAANELFGPYARAA